VTAADATVGLVDDAGVPAAQLAEAKKEAQEETPDAVHQR